MDNLSSREGSRIGVLLGAAGARLLLLAPRGPGPDSVWNAFARLEARRRKAAAQAFDALAAAIGEIAGARHGGRLCRPPQGLRP